jgi:FtsP/CotA-like multicopper oxidase with cupredoxin domain
MMKSIKHRVLLLSVLLVIAGAAQVQGAPYVQCPCPPGTPISAITGNIECTLPGPPVREIACRSITGGDSFANMADGNEVYVFGFRDVTGVAPDQILYAGELSAQTPAPTLNVREGQELYLTLTTAPMKMRPDLFDPHTVHWHGFPNASAVFDGEPMSTISVNPGASLTYYYKVPGPGTYIYHCHVEASEHMQMGMLGNLFVNPLQDGTSPGGCSFSKFAYNDGDCTTGYNVAYPVLITSFDPVFHAANLNIQPLPFAHMTDTYPMLNGRGYPDTVNPSTELGANADNNFQFTQKLPALITATEGDKILLRIVSLATVRFYTLSSPVIPMKVVGKDAVIYRGGGSPSGTDLYYMTHSVTLGGGESVDVILDTALLGDITTTKTFFLYTNNLNELSNDQEDFGGMMTEIVVNPL